MTSPLDRLVAERDVLVARLDKGWQVLDAKHPDRSVDDPSTQRWFDDWLGLLRAYEGLCDRISSVIERERRG